MKNSKVKITLLALLISQSIAVANAQTLVKSYGTTTPNPNEFTTNSLGYGNPDDPLPWRAKYKESSVNRMFIDTFYPIVPRGCKVGRAHFKITLKNLGAQNYNDTLYLTKLGGQSLYGQRIWNNNEGIGATKTLLINLFNLPQNNYVLSRPNSSIRNSIADGTFSFLVQDDTSVESARLVYHLRGGQQCRDPKGGRYKPIVRNIKHMATPKPIRKISLRHSHNGRPHQHVLPARGKAHKHGNGAVGR